MKRRCRNLLVCVKVLVLVGVKSATDDARTFMSYVRNVFLRTSTENSRAKSSRKKLLAFREKFFLFVCCLMMSALSLRSATVNA